MVSGKVNYTAKNCNLANLCGMFITALDAIDLCIDDGNTSAAQHRIAETRKTIKKLLQKNGDTTRKAKQVSTAGC